MTRGAGRKPTTFEEGATAGAGTCGATTRARSVEFDSLSRVSVGRRTGTPLVFELPQECDFSGRTLERRYVLVQKVGEGAFASVYLAHDLRMFGRKVAVKVLHPERGQSPINVERFVQEMKVAARLDGPYRDRVVKIIDHGSDGALLYLVMEFVEGTTLYSLLTITENGERRRRPIAWVQATSVILELVKALATLHASGVVHRDIKPGNVIIEQRPDGDVLRLLDLGIAKILPSHDASGNGPRTHPGFVVGTPRYMAPEQYAGGFTDARVDLFAAGVMLYEFLTGDVPAKLIDRAAKQPYTPLAPSRANPDAGIPAALDAVALRAVEAHPDARYQTADDMARALAEILVAEERVQARRQAIAEGSHERPRRPGLRGAFAVDDLDARGWVALRWWVTLASMGAAMCFVVTIAAAMRRERPDDPAFLDEAAVQALRPRVARAPAKRAAPVQPARPAAASQGPPPLPPPLPPVAPRPRPRPVSDDPPPILAVTPAGVAAGAQRAFKARCRGVKGRTMVALTVDVASARLVGAEVEADAPPRLRSCIERHAASAFQFAGLTRREPRYSFLIEL